MAKSEKLFNSLKEAIKSNNSDRIPIIIKEIELLLIDYFTKNDSYNFACIINNYIVCAKLIHEEKCYGGLAMLLNLSANATLNLIKILENGQHTLLPAIIFNQCDLNKQCQIYSLNISCISPFKRAVYKYLKEEFDIDTEHLLTTINLDQMLKKYLTSGFDNNKLFNALTESNKNNYLTDVFLYSVEYMFLTNNFTLLAEYIVSIFNKLNISNYLDLLDVVNEDDDFIRIPLLLASKEIRSYAQHNGISATELEDFKSKVYTNIATHHLAQHHLDVKKTKLNGIVLHSKPECFNDLLTELKREIMTISSDPTILATFWKNLPKLKKLTEEIIAHCILTMYKQDAKQFAAFISQFVDVIFSSTTVDLIFLNLFYLRYKGSRKIAEIIKNNPKNLKQILSWYLINSRMMNLPTMAKNGAISFAQYQKFKVAVYIQLFTEDNNITSYVDAYLLLQDAYELKDSNTYAMLINMLKNSIVELFAQNKQVEIIKLLKIKDSEEISSLFNALENNNQSKIDNIIIDLTLRKMNLYFYGKNSSNGQHFVKNHSHNSLWNKSNAESDYYVDTAEFRIKVYKKNGFSKDNIMELDPLNNLSLFTEHRWFITHYTRFSKEELEKKFDTVLELYQASLLSELNDHQKTIENKAIRKRLLDYIELKNNAEKCAELVNIDLKLLNYAYQHKLQAKVYYLLGFNYKEIAMADYLFSKHNSQSLIKLFLLQHLDFSDNYFYCFSVLEREHSSLLFKREVFQFLGLNEDIPEFTKPNLSLLENEADISKLQLWFKNEAKVMSSYMLYCSANNIHKSDWIDFIEEISNYFNTPNNQQNIFLTQTHLS